MHRLNSLTKCKQNVQTNRNNYNAPNNISAHILCNKEQIIYRYLRWIAESLRPWGRYQNSIFARYLGVYSTRIQHYKL